MQGWAVALVGVWIALLVGLWLVDARLFPERALLVLALALVATLSAGWGARRTRQAAARRESPEAIEARLQTALAALDAPKIAPAQELTGRYTAGMMLHNLGRWAEAIPHLERARALAAQTGNTSHEGHALNGIGLAQTELDPRAALDTFQQAVNLYRGMIRRRGRLDRLFGLNDPRGFEAMVLCNLAVAHLKLGEWESALQHIEAAAAVYATSGLTGGVFSENLLVQRGRALRGLGRDAEARQCLDQAQAMLDRNITVSDPDRKTLQGWIDAARAESNGVA